MAKVARKSKKDAAESVTDISEDATPKQSYTLNRKEKVRIGLGLILFVVGCYLTLSIVGYIFSWKQDQDLLISSASIWDLLFNNTATVSNFCGRLGAALAHNLVYNGIGLPVMLITIWITGIGYNLLIKKKVFPANSWGNFIALGFLFLSPLLAYLFRSASFSYGGAFGNSLIDWTSGFAGEIGIILMTLLMFSFFYFIVFQLRIQPVISVVGSMFPERKAASLVADDAPESFKGFSNPDEADEVQRAKKAAAAAQGYDYAFNTADEATPELTEEDLLEGVDLLGNTSTAAAASLSTNVQEAAPLTEALMPTLHIKKTEASTAEKELKLELSNTLVDAQIPSSTTTTENTQGVTPFDVNIAKDNTVLHSTEALAQEVNEVCAPATIITSITENGIVLEIPELLTPEAPTSTDDLAETEVPLDIQAGAQEAEAKQLNGKHFGIDTPFDATLDLADFKFPPLGLLQEVDQSDISVDRTELENNKNQIVNTLRSFGIEIQRISATVGPTVTLYEIVPAEGVRISKIKNLEDDIALNLAALGIRIIAPIPGRGTIGIEVPNTKKQIVSMRSILASEKFQNTTMSLPIALGKKIDNENYIVDLATMPHLLMAGATGQGKSVGINAILVSLLYKKHPSELKFVMVDPKKVELSIYRLIERHYLAMLPNEEEPIITDTKKVVNTLNALCIEMDNRYELLKDAGARNIKEYNEKFKARRLNPQNGHKYLPFIVLVIDEFADLIMTAGKEVEMPIARLAQLARAIGIHIIIATQRPSVNVITGIIKANFPARIAFRVSAKVDSRTILDAGGADQLIGRGDMLISIGSDLLRLQCAFVDTPEVERIVDYIGSQRGFATAFQLPEYEGAENEGISKEDIDLSKRDKMFEEAARLVVSSQSGSTSMLQRKFNLGYNRAGRIMDQLEAANIVGPSQGSKPRDVLVHTEHELENLFKELF